MHLVSDLQQRPNKGRLKMEKSIVFFYDTCGLVQLVSLIVHTVTTTVSAKRTFVNNFFLTNNFELSPTLQHKTRSCVYNTTRSIYAFSGVTMSLDARGVNDIFVDNAIQMRLAIFVMAVALCAAALNHFCVEMNIFFIKYRNFYLYKDIVSAFELLILGYVLQIGVAAKPPAMLLSDYLTACGIRTRVYLPYMNQNAIYVFVAVGYFSYVVSFFLYLCNTLPKYGVMNATEIEEYKMWLRKRNAEIAQSRALIEEAKKAHARLQIMRSSQYLGGPNGVHGDEMPMSMMPGGSIHPYPYNPAAMGGAPYQTNPYMAEMMRQGMLPPGYAAASVPPAQYFGAGVIPGAYPPQGMPPMMVPSPQLEEQLQQQLQLQELQLQSGQQSGGVSGFQNAATSPLPLKPSGMAQQQVPPLNMPRRRTVMPPDGGPARPASEYPPSTR